MPPPSPDVQPALKSPPPPLPPPLCTAGFTIITQGDLGDKFYIVKEGEATVIQDDKEVNRLLKADFFGEHALLSDEPRCVGEESVQEGGQR